MHRCIHPLWRVFLNSTNQQHELDCHCPPQASASRVQPTFFLLDAAASRSRLIIPCPHTHTPLQDSLNPPLSNSDPKPLFPALCVAEYQGHEHCFTVRKLLGLSQPQEHLWGPSGECFLGGLTDLTIWLPLNPVQSLEKLPLTRGPAAFYSKSFMCGTKH